MKPANDEREMMNDKGKRKHCRYSRAFSPFIHRPSLRVHRLPVMWDGVTQPHALQNLRKMRAGNLAIIYHTGDERAAVGLAEVTRDAYVNPEYSDEKLAVCNVRTKCRLPRAVTLKEIKAHPQLSNFDLVRLARLSVVAVNEEQWTILQQLAEVKL